MRKKLGLVFLAFAAACTSQAADNQSGRLSASADAQHAGVYAYAVDGDVVTMFDRDGIELGRVSVNMPTIDQRYFKAEMVDGTEDQVEVYRPMADGRFRAPIAADTALTATLADPALRDVWAMHDVTFQVRPERRLAPGLQPSDEATTTACTSATCSGSLCQPGGCAKPANTAQCFTNDGTHTACTSGQPGCYCCDNPSQLPAAISYRNIDTGTTWEAGGNFSSHGACSLQLTNYCGNNGAAAGCLQDPDGPRYWQAWCYAENSGNSWLASCPRAVGSACTSGQYDAVPRNGDCVFPGSCSYSTGTVSCTTYH